MIVSVAEATSTTARARVATLLSSPSLGSHGRKAGTPGRPSRADHAGRKMSAKQDSIVTATRYRPTRSRPGEICKDFRHLTNVQTRKALTRAAKGPIHGPCWAHGRPDLSVSRTLQPYLDAGVFSL